MTVQITQLPNGMRVATDTIPHAQTVAMEIWVDIGSRYEQAELNGISHFLEHMAFKGTAKRSARDIAEAFDAIGGHFNAYTSREHTVYYAKVLKNDVEVAIDILADILQHSTFDEEELVRERNVVLQELAQNNDTPDDLVFDFYQDISYPDQPLGRSILGTEEIVSNFSRQNLVEYISKHYKAPRLTFVAAGNIDHERFAQLVKNYFSSVPSCDGTPIAMESAVYKGGELRRNRDLEQVHLVVGFEAISYHHPDIYTLQVMSTVLGGGMSSRLFQEVREKHGLAYSVYSFTSSYKDTGTFGIYAGTSEDQLQKLIPILGCEVKNMITSLDADELERAKTQIRASILMAEESNYSRAEDLGRHIVCFGRDIPMEETLAEIDAVNKDKVSTMMEQVLNSTPTVSAIGKIAKLPDYEKIVGEFR